jgi:hypothetical protein
LKLIIALRQNEKNTACLGMFTGGIEFNQCSKNTKQLFPDGTPISSWFTVNKKIALPQLGKAYVITDYGVKNDSTLVQTEAIQKIIDIATEKGGVIVIPQGTFLSGALFSNLKPIYT